MAVYLAELLEFVVCVNLQWFLPWVCCCVACACQVPLELWKTTTLQKTNTLHNNNQSPVTSGGHPEGHPFAVKDSWEKVIQTMPTKWMQKRSLMVMNPKGYRKYQKSGFGNKTQFIQRSIRMCCLLTPFVPDVCVKKVFFRQTLTLTKMYRLVGVQTWDEPSLSGAHG